MWEYVIIDLPDRRIALNYEIKFLIYFVCKNIKLEIYLQENLM